MTRIGKQEERRNRSPRRPRIAGPKTGPKKDNLPKGYKERANSIDNTSADQGVFIPKIS
jgi:hypothetical protein